MQAGQGLARSGAGEGRIGAPRAGTESSMGKAKAQPQNFAPRELRQLWLSLIRASWSSVAVVPVEPGASARTVTRALIETARLHELGAFKLIDAQGASIADGDRLVKELASSLKDGGRVVIAVDSLMESLGGIPLVMAADAALLLVRLGTSDFASARSTIDIIGRERILGCVALHSR